LKPKDSDFRILAWIIWLILMLAGNIVFMNFIIAVVNESYENCMQEMQAQTYKAKLDMIKEHEQIMKSYLREGNEERDKLFTNFILVKKQSEAEKGNQEKTEWSGIIKDFKMHH